MRQFYLLIFNCLASIIYKLIRSCYGLWVFSGKNYHPVFNRVGYLHAYCLCCLAAKNVPAYKDFLQKNAFQFKFLSLSRFPETNKENYVKPYNYMDRCSHGRFKVKGTSVDESSGSSGTPYNWIRSKAELLDVHKSTANWVHMEFPHPKLFTINAFSMGAWATGVNTGIALSKVGIVKSTGPDIPKIIDTLQYFGDSFAYLITGYPPFLKHLCDELDKINFPWDKFSIYGMVGGEGMTEALRVYLQRRLKKVRSGYGATDIQIGVGGETDFTVWLRQEMLKNSKLLERLLGAGEKRIPMIFQYSPLDHYIEINEQSELVITVTNQSVISPRLRYNVKDEGRIMDFPEVVRLLTQEGYNFKSLQKQFKDGLRIPLLFLFGRKDSTISYMGSNIYPQDIEYGLYRNPEVGRDIESFCMSLEEREDLESRPVIHVELRTGVSFKEKEKADFVNSIKSGILEHLSQINRDFAESLREDKTTADIQIRLYEYGTGFFSDKTDRIKNVYLVKGHKT